MTTNPPMALIADAHLYDELSQLAAEAGCVLDRAPDLAAAWERWTCAPLILVDAAGVTEYLANVLPQRPGVVLVTTDPESSEPWRQAVQVSAERVVTLPDAAPWLVTALAAAVTNRTSAESTS